MIDNKVEVDKVSEKESIIPSEIIGDINDKIIKDYTIDKNIHFRLIENENGKFVELRKFFKSYPTKKYLRISFGKYKKINELIFNK